MKMIVPISDKLRLVLISFFFIDTLNFIVFQLLFMIRIDKMDTFWFFRFSEEIRM